MVLKLQIAAIQFNSTVGALEDNREGIITAYRKAVEDGATLVVAPEFCTVGYPLEDLVLRESFLKAAREEIGKLISSVMRCGGTVPLIFGGPDIFDPSEELDDDAGKDRRIQIYNAAYFVDPQWTPTDPDAAQDVFSPAVIIRKRDLPNYGVFDEKRVFVAAEESVGYCTLYGDMNGGFNPLKDVYKTLVFSLCKWRNCQEQQHLDELGYKGLPGTVVPQEVIDKPPSAELREDQKDEDSLPPYRILDFMLSNFIEEETSVKRVQRLLVLHGVEQYVSQVPRIRAMIDATEYKRRQSAPGIKVTKKIHGRDRRYPIVNHWRQ